MTDSRLAIRNYLPAQRAVLTSITLAVMLVPLNSTMIAVALPDILRAFNAELTTAGWLITPYLVMMAALQLVTGQLGDRFGRRRMVHVGLVYFGLVSLLAALTASMPVLIFARVQQAIAGAILVTNGFALAFEVVPEDHRGRDLGMVSAVVVLAAAGGPPLGGLLVAMGSWRAIFGVNIPIVVAALLLGWAAIPDTRPQQGKRLLDWREILLLFRNWTFASANGVILFSNLAMYMLLLGIPLLLSARNGWSSLQTGLMLAVMSLTTAVFSPVGGRLSDRVGRRTPSVAGITLLTLGVLPLAILRDANSIPFLLAALWVAGTGLGLSSASLQTSVLESVELESAGLATGLSSTSRYLGSILGSSLLATMLGLVPLEVGNFRAVFITIAIAACLALLMSWGIRDEVKKFPIQDPLIEPLLTSTDFTGETIDQAEKIVRA